MFGKKVTDELTDPVVTPKGERKKPSKKVVVIGGVVLGLVVVIGSMSVVKSMKSGLDYYDTFYSLFSNELGTYNYVLSVNTGEAGTILQNGSTEADIASLETMETQEVAEAPADEKVPEGSETSETDETTAEGSDEQQVDTKYEFSDWDKYSDVKMSEWQYPVYRVSITGETTSVDPLTTHAVVSIATPYENSKFTELTCIDGNYYLDIETMRNWLLNSSDSYLINVASQLPQGSKYLMMTEQEFKHMSWYAEDGELEFSTVSGLRPMYMRFVNSLGIIFSNVYNSIDDDCKNVGKTDSSFLVTGESATPVINALHSMVSRSGEMYDGILNSAVQKGLYNDSQLEQANREKDNVVEAFMDEAVVWGSTNADAMNFQLGGNCKTFSNGKGNQTIECNLSAVYTMNGTDYSLAFSGSRSGDKVDVVTPDGSTLAYIDYVDLGATNSVANTVHGIIDYFNFTNIAMDMKLELTPDRIVENAVNDFVTLVNEQGVSDKYLTRSNILDFIAEYEDGAKEGADIKESASAQMVDEFVTAMNNVTGGLVIEKEVVVEQEAEQYPEVELTYNGVDYRLKFNEAESDSRLIVLDGEAINKSDTTEATVDLQMFSLKSLLNSTYPANNELLLRDYNNLFDFESMETELVLAPCQWSDFTLYFAISDNDDGHMDLFVNDVQQGAVREY